jgi:hypothetical protein
MKKLFLDLERKKESYDNALKKAETEVRKICDFNARITFCEGDGHLLLNEETARVSRLNCLIGKSELNKLSDDEHENFSI